MSYQLVAELGKGFPDVAGAAPAADSFFLTMRLPLTCQAWLQLLMQGGAQMGTRSEKKYFSWTVKKYFLRLSCAAAAA